MSRILVADDEASIRFVLQEALEGDEHEVVCAADGTEERVTGFQGPQRVKATIEGLVAR